MKKFLITAVLALLTVGGTIAVTDAPASAATGSPGCVTRSEFRQVHRGMTQAQVQRVFGTRGELLDGAAGGFAQGYRRCGGGGVVVEYGWNARTNRVTLVSKSMVPRSVVNCVTLDEWRSVNPHSGFGTGGTMARVHRVFGTSGWVAVQGSDSHSSFRWQTRRYHICGSAKTRAVEYHKFGNRAWQSYWG